MDSGSDSDKRPRFLVVTVGSRAAFHTAVAAALNGLTGGGDPGTGDGPDGNGNGGTGDGPDGNGERGAADGPDGSGSPAAGDASGSGSPAAGDPGAASRLVTDVAGPLPAPPDHPEWHTVAGRARRFLDRVVPDAEVRHLAAATFPAAAGALAGALARRRSGDDRLALVLTEPDGPRRQPDGTIAAGLALLAEALGDTPHTFTSRTVLVYDRAPLGPALVAGPYGRRRAPDRDWVLAADVAVAFTDWVQLDYASTALRSASATGRSLLGEQLAAFLDARAGARWGLHYYTGSVVSGLIGDLEEHAARGGNPVLRGPSEHSLACGALARWQLDGAPFLVVVTSGMVDEFRGTLANLREARARGFLVCADSPEDAWFPFQGTVHAAEDSREVLRARGVPFHHLDDPARLEEQLRAAYASFEEDRGPVVLLATPAVLRAPARAEPRRPAPPPPRPRPVLTVREDALAPVMDLLNRGPDRVLWQCGPLDAQEEGLVHEIASRAGVALADSLTRPGTVARFRDGRPVPYYLGTLGLYGYSDRVHDFLHHGGALRPRDEQCLFFLKSRIPEAATPFSPRALARSLRIVQVTRERAHLAPFADHPLACDAAAFLRAVRARLDVPDALRDRRERAIALSRDSASDVVHTLPVRPMSANYFFARLGAVLDTLVRRHGYTWTGVFDVGRGGLSAIRNLPRTGPGFSGWYGRALMGDALQAVPALALTRDDNVLAFVGDGAAALVPDIVPTLVQEVTLNGHRLAGHLSVFRLVDGGHSVIRTYREGRRAGPAGRQTQVLHLLDAEGETDYGGLTVTRRVLDDVDHDELADRLRRPGAVDLWTVPLEHNNEGDGLSLLSSLGWQRDRLPDLAFGMARRPGPRPAR
ncbi:hypothetical protein ACFU9F_04375 [Streptomyces zhihengii]|uniref:hypothetical protein n=1 Tax=Streptomyces zhihengii TaxID=1818004 RepID=UPI0036CE6917